MLVCSIIEFQNIYLREYNTQLSPIIFYLNRHVRANLSNSSISGELHAFKSDVKPPKRIRGREDVKYLREPIYATVTARLVLSCHVLGFTFRIKAKHVCQCSPRICQFHKCSILNISFKIQYKGSGMTDYLSRTLKTEI